jgi:ribosomal protein S18 acetylase RimI-like enzyme
MPSVVLRPATEEDIEFVFRVTEDAMRGHVEATWGRWLVEEQRENCIRSFNEGTHKIIRSDAEEVGVLAVAEHPTHVQLEKLYLMAGARRQGLGSHLLAQVVGLAHASHRPVRLRVLAVNTAAQRFYKGHGFTVSSQTPERVFMERACET